MTKHIHKKIYYFIVNIAAASLLLPGNSHAEVVVVVSSQVKASSVSASHLKKIYLGKKRSLPGGQRVNPVEQREGSPAHKKFHSQVINKSPSQFKSYWSKMIFSGKGTPPKIVGGDGQVMNWVRNNPGSIGYVDGSFADSSVRVLLRIP